MTAGAYLLVVAVLLLLALAVSIPVLLEIAREGRERMRERMRERETGGWERYREAPGRDAGPPALEETADPTAVVCPHCGAENEPGFSYCRGCAGRL